MTDRSIMGPGGWTTTSNGNTNNTRRFDTVNNDKMRYNLTKCTTTIRKMSKVYIKFKSIRDNIDIVVYMNYDQAADHLLKRAEKNCSLNL